MTAIGTDAVASGAATGMRKWRRCAQRQSRLPAECQDAQGLYGGVGEAHGREGRSSRSGHRRAAGGRRNEPEGHRCRFERAQDPDRARRWRMDRRRRSCASSIASDRVGPIASSAGGTPFRHSAEGSLTAPPAIEPGLLERFKPRVRSPRPPLPRRDPHLGGRRVCACGRWESRSIRAHVFHNCFLTRQ